MTFADKHIHFVGIGGVSMNALARLTELDGATVSGSDLTVGNGHDADNIHAGLDSVVINGAITDDNPELLRARQLNIQIIERAELLAQIEHRYANRIAVAGSHGKSTTTAMIGAVLTAGGLNPTVHNGAMPNLRVGGKEFFVTEACEFKRSFLHLSPTVAVITNIDFDHVDCYKDIDDVRQTFKQFTDKAPTVFYTDNVPDIDLELTVPGAHNIGNARLAAAVGLHFGVPLNIIKKALEEFKGIERRFEKIGEIGMCDLITDYAHHPSEIITTIKTAQDLYGKSRFLIVFQPHTYTRTLALFDDFVQVLQTVPCALYRTFASREKPVKGGSALDLSRALRRRYFAGKDALRRYLVRMAGKYDAIILTGAGDVNKIITAKNI